MQKSENVSVIGHLKSAEIDRVTSILNDAGIPHHVCDDGVKKHNNLYFHVEVSEQFFDRAQRIIAKNRAQIFIDSRECPHCQHEGYSLIPRPGFWKRLMYIGTTLVQCNSCKQEFGI